MQGLITLTIIFGMLIAGAEQGAPGIVAEAVRVAAMIYADPQLPGQLDAAITAKESSP